MTTFVLLLFPPIMLPSHCMKRIHGGYIHLATAGLDGKRYMSTPIHPCTEVNPEVMKLACLWTRVFRFSK